MEVVYNSYRVHEENIMEILQNPNVIYLMLAGGLIFAVLALVSPGTGVLELGALFILGLAGWSVIQYDLSINWLALFILLAGIVLFFVAVRKPKVWILLLVSIIAIVLGSAFIFSGQVWYIPGVDPLLSSIVSILSGLFFWITARKVMEARSIRPSHDLEALEGTIGEAKTKIHAEGSVQVAGELWSARSEAPIPNGARVRVLARDGFILTVEAAEEID
jgi:membrane-bound serine protease (ClpP class)